MQSLNLSSLSGGQLNKEFEAAYKDIVDSLNHGEKATITIKVELSRIPDTQTMFNVKHDIKVANPPIKKSSICKIENGELLTEDAVKENLLPFMAEAKEA